MPEAIADTGTGDAAAAAAAAAAAGAKPWFDGQSAEVVGYLQNRGLDKLTPAEAAFKAIEAHRNAEAKLGTPADLLVRLPKDTTDTATRDALWAKLGRPADAKGYEFAKIEGVDQAFADWAGATAFNLGLTKSQGEDFVRELVKTTAAQGKAALDAQVAANEVERQALLKNWGPNANANLYAAEKAAGALGFTPDMVKAIEGQAGFKNTMEMLLKLGTKMGEDTFLNVPGSGTQRLTKEGAVERIAALKADTAWTAKYLAGDAAARKEMSDLIAVGYGA